MGRRGRIGLLLLACGLLACLSPLRRGEQLYRQGDVRAAIDVWRAVPDSSRDHEAVQARLDVVRAEFERRLTRYQKRAEFFEAEQRLAEAVLYYRLAYKMDPERRPLLDRVQKLVRELRARTNEERAGLADALEAGDLIAASLHADRLEALDPFDPAVQIEIRQAHAATGASIQQHMARGEMAYAAGDRASARREFEEVLRLDPYEERALGYLSYIDRFEALEARHQLPPPPISISQEEIIAEGHYRSAIAAEQTGETFQAIRQYETALSVNPKHEGARRKLVALRARHKPRVDGLYQRGKRYFQEEDLHNALRMWRQALAIDPDDGRTRENVERAERMLARLEEIQTGANPGS